MRHVRSLSSFIPVSSCLVLLLLGAGLFAGCGPASQHPARSVTRTISAAKGGTITNGGGASLVIPPHALSGDAHVTLSDIGNPPHTNGDPLEYISNAFRVTATPVTGKAPITLQHAAILSVTGHTDKQVKDTIVAEADPARPGYITLNDWHNDFNTQGNSGSGREFYQTLGALDWMIELPQAQQPTPTEGSVLQVPWYYQGGLPWCVPTSLTEMLRYYDFSENAGDPLNANFGQTEALANWQVAAQNHQGAKALANYNELNAIGITDYWDPDLTNPSTYQLVNSGPHTLHYAWDDRFLLAPPGTANASQYLKNSDLAAYVTLVNTGLFGLTDRKPLAFVISRLGHSLVIVGVDGNGLYIHDSNGSIAEYVTWANLDTTNFGLGNTPSQHQLETAVVYGVPIKPADEREGSIVLAQNDFYFATPGGGTANLTWDGSTAHPHGYYFLDNNSASANLDLGASVPLGGTMNYGFQVANVTNTKLTYTVVVEQSINTYGNAITRQSHQVTVDPYSESNLITGSFGEPSFGASQGIIDVKLLGVNNQSIVQDVKYVWFTFGGAYPVISITAPANNSAVTAGASFALVARAFDGAGNRLPDSAVTWTASSSQNSLTLGQGNTLITSIPQPGTYTIEATATSGGLTTNATPITLVVNPQQAPPPQPTVQILSPTNGQEIVQGSSGFSVTLSSSASAGVVSYSWTDSAGLIHDSQANGTVTIPQSQVGCADLNDTITLTVTDSHGQTASASVAITFLPECIQ